MYVYRIFGALMGELTRDWTPVEAESIEAARTWPLVDIANTIEAPQAWHVVLRSLDGEERQRGDVEFDGERMVEKWLREGDLELGMAAQ